MNRRDVLRLGLGGSALAVAGRNLAGAADGASAKPRFIFLYTPCGRNPTWRTGVSGPDFTLGPTMTMFEPYRKKLCLLDGFTTVNFGYHINAHWGPLHTMLGGHPPLRRPGDQGGALSVGSQRTFDHLLADRLGGQTAVRNIVIGGRDQNNGTGSNSLMASWLAPATPMHPVHNSDQTLAALFGSPHDEKALAAMRDPKAIGRSLALETQILDLSRANLGSWKKALGRHEQLQLAAYETNLKEVHDQVVRESPELVAQRNTLACKRPDLAGLSENLPDSDEYGRHHDLQSRVLAAALACGRTQVATYVMAGIGSKMTVPGFSNSHHYHNDSALDHYVAFDRYYGDRVKFLLDELARYPEGNGTVLDNTIVLWTTDIGWTPLEHDHENIPIYLFGGLPGGRLRMGQYLKAPFDNVGGDRVKALANPQNRRLHEVLLTLGEAVGLRNFEGFSDPKFTQGLIKELLT